MVVHCGTAVSVLVVVPGVLVGRNYPGVLGLLGLLGLPGLPGYQCSGTWYQVPRTLVQ